MDIIKLHAGRMLELGEKFKKMKDSDIYIHPDRLSDEIVLMITATEMLDEVFCRMTVKGHKTRRASIFVTYDPDDEGGAIMYRTDKDGRFDTRKSDRFGIKGQV